MSHGDANASEKKLLKKYQMTKVFGVTNLLEDIHDLREQRFQGTDTTFLSCLLIDFERLLNKASLTIRQKEAMFLRFEKDLTQDEVADAMDISQQAVSKHIDNAIKKVVSIAREDERLEKLV